MSEVAEIKFDSKQWDKILKSLGTKVKSLSASGHSRTERAEWSGAVSSVVFRDIMDHFKNEQGPKGPWDRFSRSYQQAIAGLVAFRWINGQVVPITSDKFLRKNKPPRKPGKLLQVTGRLRNSMSPDNWRGTKDGLLFYNKAETASGFPYAAHHNQGPSSYKGNPRPFMWISGKAMDTIARVTLKWLLTKDKD